MFLRVSGVEPIEYDLKVFIILDIMVDHVYTSDEFIIEIKILTTTLEIKPLMWH